MVETAVVSADFHPAGRFGFDDAVHGELRREVVVDGTGVIGGMPQREVLAGALRRAGGCQDREQEKEVSGTHNCEVTK